MPHDRPLPDLTAELVTMLGSTSPLERDEVAYPVLATWIGEGVYDDLLVSFGDSITNGFTVGLGEPAGDRVFRRSFSALALTVCIDRDNSAHLLPVDTVLNWADRSITWYTRERDLRGWVPEKGWAHTVAHGADLLGVLGQSRHLEAQHLMVLLDVIAERLGASDGLPLVDGEDDRLALATLMILQRNLIDTTQLEAWVETLAVLTEQRGADDHGGSGKPGGTLSAWNTSNYLRALHVHLAIGPSPLGSPGLFDPPPTCRADLLLALLKAIPRHTPWLYSRLTSADD